MRWLHQEVLVELIPKGVYVCEINGTGKREWRASPKPFRRMSIVRA